MFGIFRFRVLFIMVSIRIRFGLGFYVFLFFVFVYLSFFRLSVGWSGGEDLNIWRLFLMGVFYEVGLMWIFFFYSKRFIVSFNGYFYFKEIIVICKCNCLYMLKFLLDINFWE